MISIDVNKLDVRCKTSFRKEKSLRLSVMADYADNIRYQIKSSSIPEK